MASCVTSSASWSLRKSQRARLYPALMWGSTTASNESTRCGNTPPSGQVQPLDQGTGDFIPAPPQERSQCREGRSWDWLRTNILRFRPRWCSVLRRQAPLLLLVAYLEGAEVASGERREEILEMAHFWADADGGGGGVPRTQDSGRQLGAVIRVVLVRSRIGVGVCEHGTRLEL